MEQIKHLLNLNSQRLIVLGGLQGSSKSTTAKQFEDIGYEVVCPDRIRVEYAQKEPGNEDKLEGELTKLLMKYEDKVWADAKNRVISHLQNGKSVVFDATMVNLKARKQILQWVKSLNVYTVALYLECPLEIALERNLKRSKTIVGTSKDGKPVLGRYVPSHIIELKSQTQVLPTISEGFDEIIIIHVGLTPCEDKLASKKLIDLYYENDLEAKLQQMKNNGDLEKILPSLYKCWDVDQENKNHNLLLHQHMINAAKYLQKESLALFIAGLLHDVGKFDTKAKYGKLLTNTEVFKTGEKVKIQPVNNKKGFIIAKKLDYKGNRSELLTIKHIDTDDNAHYYEHNICGAILARRDLIALGCKEDLTSEIYEYILYHMDLPFQKIEDKKTINKLINRVGVENIQAMIKLREADKTSSLGDKYFEEVHPANIKLIEEVIEERTEKECIKECIKETIKELVSCFGKTEEEAKEYIKSAKIYELLIQNPIGVHESAHNWAVDILTKNNNREILERYYEE